jgi:septal ring factor EnvC (AmiA/AmiB activator)
MVKRWFVIGVILIVSLLLVSCNAAEGDQSAVQDVSQVQIASLQNQLNEAQTSLAEAEDQIELLQSELADAGEQIEDLETELANEQNAGAQMLNQISRLESQLSTLRSQVSDYNVIADKVDMAVIYAEMLDRYLLVEAHYQLSAEDRIALDHLVNSTDNDNLKEKWAPFYFSDDDDDKVEFLIALGDGLWEVLQ